MLKHVSSLKVIAISDQTLRKVSVFPRRLAPYLCTRNIDIFKIDIFNRILESSGEVLIFAISALSFAISALSLR